MAWLKPERLRSKPIMVWRGRKCTNLHGEITSARLAGFGCKEGMLIEFTGIVKSLPVVAIFDFRDENGFSLSDVAELNTGLFDFAKGEQNPLWFKELYGFKDHILEMEEYDIRSFVYHTKHLFGAVRF